MRKIFFIFLTIFILSGCTDEKNKNAGNLKDSEATTKLPSDSLNEKNHTGTEQIAIKNLTEKATKGDSEAQLELTKKYLTGSTEINRTQATYWLNQAAVNNSPDAQFILSACYQGGCPNLHLEKNDEKAIFWMRKAAVHQPNVDSSIVSQLSLADIYYNGTGTKKDFTEAASWYTSAAKLGSAQAQYSIGYMYLHGEGVSKDITKSIFWLKKAASNQPSNETTSARTTSSDSCYPAIAASLVSQLALMAKDYHHEYYWLLKSTNNNCKYLTRSTDEANLGLFYYNGWTIPRDFKKAAYWFEKSAKKGNADAQHSLGLMYQEGIGVLKDSVLAYAWLNVAVANGYIKNYASSQRDYLYKLLSTSQKKEADTLSQEYWNLYSQNSSLENSETTSNENKNNSTHYTLQAGDTIYSARSGDTLESIANRFNVTSDAILYANSLSGLTQLQSGTKLIIPTHA